MPGMGRHVKSDTGHRSRVASAVCLWLTDREDDGPRFLAHALKCGVTNNPLLGSWEADYNE